MGQMRHMLAIPTPGLAKGQKVMIRHVTTHEFDTPALDVLVMK